MYKNFKEKAFDIIQADDGNNIWSKVFDIFIIALICVNVVVVIVETFNISASMRRAVSGIETASVVIFTIEYLLRIWTADLLYDNMGALKSRLRYAVSFLAVIDLLAILPFYIPFVFPVDLRVLRMLRMIRLFRLFKMSRYTSAFSTIGMVFKRKATQLISSVIVVLILMIISSVLMYNVEHTAQPEKFENAFSGLWWAVSTFTTVGYGDVFPITVFGKILSSIIALLGIGLVAVPTGIISAGFIEVVNEEKNGEETIDHKHFCPYCGGRLD